jgi:outer membrane protein assembly factor BamB
MYRAFSLTLLVLAAYCVLPTAHCPLPTAEAAKVKVWYHHSPAHFDKAQIKQAVISSEGAVRLSRQVKLLTALKATHVWDVVEDKDGNLLVATGEEGKIYKVTPDGKATVLYESEESQILCLALAADGTLFAGTGPGGLVVRIEPKGNAKVLFHSPELYVWSLALDPQGQTLYAGTGPKGRIYRVTRDGKGSVFYSTKQEHILCLAMGPDGTLYAGTDKNGLVYRIDPRAKGFVLFQAPQAEVRSLLVAPDGVYAGTSATTRRRLGAGALTSSPGGPNLSSSLGPGSRMAAKDRDTGTAAAEVRPGASDGEARPTGDASKTVAAMTVSPPSAGDNSLYRIAPDGTVREVFREKALILSLLRGQGRIFIGTGMDAQLFEVDAASRERSEIARLDHGQIHCLYRRHDGSIVIGTGDPGKLYVLQDGYARKGTVVSEVLDAKIISKWGSLRWQADTPPGTAVTVAVRSGNQAEPDETWSDWSAEQTDPQQGIIATPPARFLQYRVTLTTDHAKETPALHGVTLRYMTTNQAPEVTVIEVPDLDAGNLENPKKLKFRWTASDQNDDELTFNVYVRKEGWKNWVLLEEGYEKKDFEWDTTTTPAGMYQLRVVASDRKDNPDEDALTGERVSAPFAVAHEPPAVSVRFTGMEGDQAILEATASDELVRLTAASFAVNGKKWVNIFPSDGLFDSKKETFKFKTESLKPGTYVLVLRVRDAASNTGSGDVVFTVPARKETR